MVAIEIGEEEKKSWTGWEADGGIRSEGSPKK